MSIKIFLHNNTFEYINTILHLFQIVLFCMESWFSRMSAQQDQTESAPAAAAPAAPKQYFKGWVKQVMDGGDQLLIVLQPR